MLLDLCRQLGLARDEVAMVGDRIYTDIAMAQDADVFSVLVLSGEATAADTAGLARPPDLILDDVGVLGTELLLLGPQRLTEQRLGAGLVAGLLQCHREKDHGLQRLGVIGRQFLPAEPERLFVQR